MAQALVPVLMLMLVLVQALVLVLMLALVLVLVLVIVLVLVLVLLLVLALVLALQQLSSSGTVPARCTCWLARGMQRSHVPLRACVRALTGSLTCASDRRCSPPCALRTLTAICQTTSFARALSCAPCGSSLRCLCPCSAP